MSRALRQAPIGLNLSGLVFCRPRAKGEQMKRLIVGTFVVTLFASFPAAAQNHPFITTDWADIQVSQEDCLNRAEQAIANNGFKSPGTTKNSRHGYRGQYTTAVRCAADKGFVFFIVAGPDGDLTEKYEIAIKNAF
jgi:hypothetical protein